MIRRPPRSTLSSSSAASDVYKRQVYHSSRYRPYDNITLLLYRVHCRLCAPERITYKVAMLVYQCVSMDLLYSLSLDFPVDIATPALVIDLSTGSTRLSTIGDRAFPVAAAIT